MVLGMSLETFTVLHVVISLVGIASGLVVLFGLLNGKLVDRWTATFLVSTILTSATGYLFPVHRLLPSHVVGGISLVRWRSPLQPGTVSRLPELGARPMWSRR